jgi:hypothetical protein
MTSSWNFMGVSDIALVLLDRPSTMRPLLHLPPAAPRPAVAPGTLLTAIGWSEDRHFIPLVLQKGTLEVIPSQECESHIPVPPEWFKWDWQFCAGRPSKGVNPCSGDNGFPLIWKGPTGDVAVGVTTRSGAGCGGLPNVYADMAVASNWIRNTIQWMVHEDAAGRIPGPATG